MERDAPIVFDAEPLLAYLNGEPGSDVVRRVIEDVRDGTRKGFINYLTLCELTYIAERTLDQSSVHEFVETLLDYGIQPVETAEVWYRAARNKNDYAISLGDAVMLATAQEKQATGFVGADADFDSVPDERIERFRTDPA